jgi:hypothetical protein
VWFLILVDFTVSIFADEACSPSIEEGEVFSPPGVPTVGSGGQPTKSGSARARLGASAGAAGPSSAAGGSSSPGLVSAPAPGVSVPPKLTGPLTASASGIKVPDAQLPAEVGKLRRDLFQLRMDRDRINTELTVAHNELRSVRHSVETERQRFAAASVLSL